MHIQSKDSLLVQHDFAVKPRDPAIRPAHPGAWMVVDTLDADGFAIVGDDKDALIDEALAHLELV